METSQSHILPGIPAPSNNPGEEFPRIHPDGRLTFRIRADMARKVEVRTRVADNNETNGFCRLGLCHEMKRGEDGFWTVTTPPVMPGFYYYVIVVDGVEMNDPGSRASFNSRELSYIEVPEKEVTFWDPQDVPHGEVRQHWYYSEINGAWRRAFVYTPPDYDEEKEREHRYPVLYLQHGGGQNESSWVMAGRANFILDNLIDPKTAVRMMVVMDNGYVFPQDLTRGPEPAPPGNPFERVLINEIIPMIDAAYRTVPDREHRAMAGLSRGAHQTLQITLAHLDMFSYIGAFSPHPMDFDVKTYYSGVLANASEVNEKLSLFYWGRGTAEEGIHKSINETLAKLDQASINYTHKEWPGLVHEWRLWRECLNDFVPRLFRRLKDKKNTGGRA